MGYKIMRSANALNAARATEDLLRLARRAEAAGFPELIDEYVPRSGGTARDLYAAAYRFRRAIEAKEAEKIFFNNSTP